MISTYRRWAELTHHPLSESNNVTHAAVHFASESAPPLLKRLSFEQHVAFPPFGAAMSQLGLRDDPTMPTCLCLHVPMYGMHLSCKACAGCTSLAVRGLHIYAQPSATPHMPTHAVVPPESRNSYASTPSTHFGECHPPGACLLASPVKFQRVLYGAICISIKKTPVFRVDSDRLRGHWDAEAESASHASPLTAQRQKQGL